MKTSLYQLKIQARYPHSAITIYTLKLPKNNKAKGKKIRTRSWQTKCRAADRHISSAASKAIRSAAPNRWVRGH